MAFLFAEFPATLKRERLRKTNKQKQKQKQKDSKRKGGETERWIDKKDGKRERQT